MRITKPVDNAIAPTLTLPWLHSQIASADVPTIRNPLSVVMLASIPVVRRVMRRSLLVCSPIASAT